MARFYTTLTSNKGSIKFLEGTFFDYSMKDVYVPLDNKDFRDFLTRVNSEEDAVGRRLTSDELVVLATAYVAETS